MPTGNEWVTSGPGSKDPPTVTLPRDHRSDRDQGVTVTVTRDQKEPQRSDWVARSSFERVKEQRDRYRRERDEAIAARDAYERQILQSIREKARK